MNITNKKVPLKTVIDAVSNEKGVSEEIIFSAIESALESATKKKYGSMDIDVKVILDPKDGSYVTRRIWTVVEDPPINVPLSEPFKQITISAAKFENPSANIGDKVEEEMESVDFGRIAAQTAKQVIIQKVREAERNKIVEEYIQRVGEVLTGIVKKVTRDNILVDLGNNAEGLLPRAFVLPRENIRLGEKVRAYLYEVDKDARGAQLLLSRTHPQMLVELFKIEVPEVGEGIIQIKSVAREPGVRAKIAVHTNDGRLDPIGACVGMRGSRVQAVSNELGGERIDIVLWHEDIAQFVMNSMAPAEIASIMMDEEAKTMTLAVKESSLSQAIGRNGQNVRLATELTKWNLNIVSDKELEDEQNKEQETIKNTYVQMLQLSDEQALAIINAGLLSLEEIAYGDEVDLTTIPGFTNESVTMLKETAKNALLAQAIAMQVQVGEDLISLPGITQDIVNKLQDANILTLENLADLSRDELIEITQIDEKEADRLILAARKHWFS